MLQGHAIQKLHGNERMTIVLADFVDRADVRNQSLRFAIEILFSAAHARLKGTAKIAGSQAEEPAHSDRTRFRHL